MGSNLENWTFKKFSDCRVYIFDAQVLILIGFFVFHALKCAVGEKLICQKIKKIKNKNKYISGNWDELGIWSICINNAYFWWIAVFFNSFMVGWLVEFYGISTFVGYLMPNPFLCKY